MRRCRRPWAAIAAAAVSTALTALTVVTAGSPAAAATTVRGACSTAGRQVATVAVTYHVEGRKWNAPVVIDRLAVTTRSAEVRSAVLLVTRQSGTVLARRQGTGVSTFAGFPRGTVSAGVLARVALTDRGGRSLCGIAVPVGPYQPR